MDGVVTLAFLVLLLSVLDCALGEYCRERYYSHFYHEHRYREIHCTWGCCGSSYDEYCCVSNAGIIVGIVFAAIFGISLITAFICCVIKHKGSRGRVVRPVDQSAAVVGPSANTNVFIVPTGPAPPPYSAAAYSAAGYPGYPMGPSAPMPPAYSTQTRPPAYNYDPNFMQAYPPAYSTVTPAQRANGGK